MASSSWTLTAIASASPSRPPSARDLGGSGVEVCLGQRERRRHAAGQRQRHEPFRAAHLGLGQRLDDEHEVYVRRQHLRRERCARGSAHDGAVAGQHGGDRAVGIERHPVARRGRIGVAQPSASGHEPRRAGQSRDEPARAVLRQHAARGEAGVAELVELGFEIGSPAEAGGQDLHQRILHVVVRGTVAMTGACGRGPAPA